MSKTIKAANLRDMKTLVARMQEPGRTSVTLSRADIQVILPVLKKEIGE